VAQRAARNPLEIYNSLKVVLEKAQPLSPQSSVTALEKGLSILSMPKDSLTHVFPDQSDEHFFDHLLRTLEDLGLKEVSSSHLP
jgi:hypothetical protein